MAELDELLAAEKSAPKHPNAGQPHFLDGYDERVAMLEQVRDFLRDRLLAKTGVYSGHNKLNRHGILHGVFPGYGYESSFHRLVSLLMSSSSSFP